MQDMCKYYRELFLSIYILFTCKHYLRKNRDRVKFTWELCWKNKTYKLKRAIDHPMVIRISESGKLLLVESGIREFFSWNPESWALEFDDWNPKSICHISVSLYRRPLRRCMRNKMLRSANAKYHYILPFLP